MTAYYYDEKLGTLTTGTVGSLCVEVQMETFTPFLQTLHVRKWLINRGAISTSISNNYLLDSKKPLKCKSTFLEKKLT